MPGGFAAAGLIISAISALAGGISSYQSSKRQQRNYAAQVKANTFQYFRDVAWRDMQSSMEHQSFISDMAWKQTQARMQNTEWMSNYQFKKDQMYLDIQNQENALVYEHANRMAAFDSAQADIENAHDSTLFDLEAMGDRWEQTFESASLDKFERQRQAMKEAAKIRVSQGESGIHGNTALKELANSMMQASYDTGIIGHNFKNASKQIGSETQKVLSGGKHRTNRSISSVPLVLDPAANLNTNFMRGNALKG